MAHAYIAGTGSTTFGKATASLSELSEAAVAEALADAGLEPAEVGSVFYGNGAAGLLQGQEMIRGQVALAGTGLLGAAVYNVENACASSSSALSLAVSAVLSEQCDVAIAVGAEKLVVGDSRRTFAALAAACDTVRREDMREIVERDALGFTSAVDADLSASPLMLHYAGKSAEYLKMSGGTSEDLARVVVKSRINALSNPVAHLRRETSLRDVLESRMIADPLTMFMCAPISDGAAAAVVVNEATARRLRSTLRVRASVVASHNPTSGVSPTRMAADRAYAKAGIEPRDVDVVEVHDAAAGAELWIMEELNLCGRGEAVQMLRDGRTSLTGDLPVNTGGGLLSRGHPIGATGCAQIVELANQLRGRAGSRQVPGRLGLAQNGGGVFVGDEATVTVTVLEAV